MAAVPAAGVARQSVPPTPSGPIALVGGTLIDGTGAAPLRDSVVLLRGERIEKVGTTTTLPVPAGYERVSTEGLTLLPGLWDPHVHLIYGGHTDLAYWHQQYGSQFERVIMPATAAQLLMAGVTTARDMGAPLAILAVRQRIASGEIAGPSLYVAGPQINNGAAPVMTHALRVAGVPDARAKVRELVDAGVDIIKISNAEQLQPADLRAIVTDAHARGLKVAAHGRTDAEIRLGLTAGVDEFQHIGTASPEYPADIVASIRERQRTGPPLYWSPTIGAQLGADDLAADAEFLDDPRAYQGLPAVIADDVRTAVAKAPRRPAAPATAVIVKRKIAQLRELRVDLVFGSDVGGFGAPATEGTWRELDAWVGELAMEPMAALRKATLEAATYLGGQRDSGSVVEGKYADIIAVAGNPLRHIDVLRDPAMVIKRGRRYR